MKSARYQNGKMESIYQYYKDLCKCPGMTTAGVGSDGSTMYDYFRGYCVCDGQRIYLGMRDLDENEVSNYPVTVYNINEEEIGYAVSKGQYITIWNSDPDNQEVGILQSGGGPFAFLLVLNSGQLAPPWVLGVADAVDFGIYESSYSIEYE